MPGITSAKNGNVQHSFRFLSQSSKIVPIKTASLRYAVCGCCLCIKNANCYSPWLPSRSSSSTQPVSMLKWQVLLSALHGSPPGRHSWTLPTTGEPKPHRGFGSGAAHRRPFKSSYPHKKKNSAQCAEFFKCRNAIQIRTISL